jgi:broad specificity polyphosphatase/5'/3'-nucleotidase SurE
METSLKGVLSLFRKSKRRQQTKVPHTCPPKPRESHWSLNLPLVRFSERGGVDFAENLVTLLVDIASIQKRTEPTGSEAHFWLPQKKSPKANTDRDHAATEGGEIEAMGERLESDAVNGCVATL